MTKVYIGDRSHSANKGWFSEASTVASIPCVLDIVSHGRWDRIDAAVGRGISADEFSREILSNAALQSRVEAATEIRLLACWTGCRDDGFAQKLADQMASQFMPRDGRLASLMGKFVLGSPRN